MLEEQQGRGRDGGMGGAGRRQRSAVEPSQSRPASRQALSHGTSWKHSHISILPVPVPDPVELSIVWSMGFAGRSPGAPRTLDYSKSHPPSSSPTHFHDPCPPWCLMPQHLAGLFFSLLFFASCPFLPFSFPSDKALLWVGGGRGMPPAQAGEPSSHCGCTPEWRRSLELLNSLFFLSSKAAVC